MLLQIRSVKKSIGYAKDCVASAAGFEIFFLFRNGVGLCTGVMHTFAVPVDLEIRPRDVKPTFSSMREAYLSRQLSRIASQQRA